MADKAEQKDPRTEAREAELRRQAKLERAIHNRTHDGDKPKPIVIEG